MILTICLPLFINYENGMYCYGPATNLLYTYMTIVTILLSIIFVFRFKYVNKKKYIPCLVFIFGCGAIAIVQKYFPYITLSTPMEMLILFIMYFTIENPDVAMINQLEIAKDQAEKANLAKTDFLSSMSHEIRTPLNAIVGFAQSLNDEKGLSKEGKDEVNDIIDASNTLMEIVNGILDISKIEANKIEISNTEYNFMKLYNELCALSKARLGESKPIELSCYIDPSTPEVLYGDQIRVKQVILNILTNAIKYTNEGYIKFRIDSIINNDICRLVISVEDSGIGIKKENINKLFSKFERLEATNSTIEGTGLGMAITKKLVDSCFCPVRSKSSDYSHKYGLCVHLL